MYRNGWVPTAPGGGVRVYISVRGGRYRNSIGNNLRAVHVFWGGTRKRNTASGERMKNRAGESERTGRRYNNNTYRITL